MNMNRVTDTKGNTPLHDLCGRSGTTPDDILRALAQGADINHQNYSGLPPLATAIQNGNADLARCLVEQGADLFFIGRRGSPFNALSLASIKGHPNMVEMLLQHGAGIHVNKTGVDFHGYDAQFPCLHLALKNSNGGVIDALLAAGALVNQEAGEPLQKSAPIHLAVQHCFPVVVKKILASGGDIEHPQPQTGRRPLHLAIALDRGLNAENLINLGADINAVDGRGLTPLMVAARRNSMSSVKALLAMPGIEIDRQQDQPPRHTALMIAAEEGFMELIKHLLAAGANATLADAFNNTAANIAQQKKYNATSEILRQAEDKKNHGRFDDLYKRHKPK